MGGRLKLIVAYDGTDFEGWQSQRSGNTIQDRLERAIEAVAEKPVRVHGAGRTDAGVHALGQCAHVDVPKRLPAHRWPGAINSTLPHTIRVLRCSYAKGNFHAQHSAKSKVYRYRIWNAPVLPPLEYCRCWHVVRPLDMDVVRHAANLFEGSHDFRSFSANRGQPAESTSRQIFHVKVRRRGPEISLEVEGDGFLYKMVRLMVGAIVGCAEGKRPVASIARELEKPGSHRARVAAPACGLTLLRVRY